MEKTTRIYGNSLYVLFKAIGENKKIYSVGGIDKIETGYTCVAWIK